MKMLCIRGKQVPALHTGLVSGQVYEVDLTKPCCGPAAYATGSVFKRSVMLHCLRCGSVERLAKGAPVPWGPDRFIPWNPQAISEKEVQALYEPLTKEPA